jgi:hypothetical protein
MMVALQWQWSSNTCHWQAPEIDFAASNAKIGQELIAGEVFW